MKFVGSSLIVLVRLGHESYIVLLYIFFNENFYPLFHLLGLSIMNISMKVVILNFCCSTLFNYDESFL